MERKQAQHSVDALRRLPGGKPAKLRDHGQVFQPGKVVVEVWLLRDIAHAPLVGNQIVLNGFALKQDMAQSHLDQAGDHLHGGGLARAVRPQVAGHFAGPGREADVIHGGNAGEVLGDAAKFKQE